MRARLTDFFRLIIETIDAWSRHGAAHLAAALSFYSIFAAAPLLIIIVGLAGIFLDREEVQAFLFVQVSHLAGTSVGDTLSQLVANTPTTRTGVLTTIIGVVTLFLTAGGVIHFLRFSLNRVWNLTPPPPKHGILDSLLDQVVAWLIILVGGGMLVLSMLGSALVGLFNERLIHRFPELANIIPSFSPLVLFGVIFLIFVLIFRFIPSGSMRIRDILPGALFTIILFAVGQFFISLYLRFTSFSSVYGAAGSLVALLVWVNYSAQIFFLGAEFTLKCATKYGAGITPFLPPAPTAPPPAPTP